MPAAGIVLAAGASTRMGGRNKMLAEIGGETLVRRAARRALEAGLSPVLVVVGRDAERVEAELEGLGVECVRNPDFTGPSGDSLRLGLRALPDDAEAAVVSLADMVHVTAAMLAALAAETYAPVVASRYGGVVAPPVRFAREAFERVLAEAGRPKGLAKRFVDWPARALTDVDSPTDLDDV